MPNFTIVSYLYIYATSFNAMLPYGKDMLCWFLDQNTMEIMSINQSWAVNN